MAIAEANTADPHLSRRAFTTVGWTSAPIAQHAIEKTRWCNKVLPSWVNCISDMLQVSPVTIAQIAPRLGRITAELSSRGTGGAGQAQFATLSSRPTGLTNADFLVI